MFTESQNRRIANKVVSTVLKVLDDWPAMLEAADSDAAAEIVAGIIKAQLSRPTPPVDPSQALNTMLRKFSGQDDETAEP